MDDRTADDSREPTADEPVASDGTGPREGPSGREVVVPMRLYKTVTVFSTLIAVVLFVLGFVLIDAATLQISLIRRTVITVLAVGGVSPATDVLTALLAIAGLSLIALGSAVYVFGTRFRARGMGKPQEDSSEGSDNG